jgi:tellurite resistance protein TerC
MAHALQKRTVKGVWGMVKETMAASYKTGRKLVIGVVGLAVLVVGIAMLVLPGPAVVVIPLGLGILAAEFAWARRWLERLRDRLSRVVGRFRRAAA